MRPSEGSYFDIFSNSFKVPWPGLTGRYIAHSLTYDYYYYLCLPFNVEA
jgi:hypothetical protein